MFDTERFAQSLRDCRKARGITQNELARLLFVTPQSVSKWERGEVLPDVVHLCEMAALLEVPVDTLLNSRGFEGRGLIGIDGGGTKTEIVLIDEKGKKLNSVVLEGSNPNAGGIDRAVEILRRGITMMKPHEWNVMGIYLGGAGLGNEKNEEAVCTALEEAWPGIKIGCGSDIQNVIACCSSPDNCIAVISGTGCVVYSNHKGVLRRTGGAGYRFEKGGSGYDLGCDAISAALEDRDGTGEETMLTSLVEEKLGGDPWENIHVLYRKDVAGIAAFAPLVSRAARQGDEVALEILERNSTHLAKLIDRAWELAPTVRRVILSGSMLMKDEMFYRMVVGKISPQLEPERMTMPPVWGACLQCARMCGLREMPSAALFTGKGNDR